MKRIIFALFLPVLFFQALPSFAFGSKTEEAASEYNSGNYRKAYELYYAEALRSDGAKAWYNAGNAQYQLKNKSEAMFCYIKAFLLSPRDKYINANLSAVFSDTKQIFYHSGFGGMIERGWYYLSVREIYGTALFYFWLACFSGCGLLLFRNPRAVSCIRELLLCFIILFCAAFAWYGLRLGSGRYVSAGIVKAEVRTVIQSGPGPGFAVIAELPDGMLVKILKEDKEFYEISASGVRGWISKKNLLSL